MSLNIDIDNPNDIARLIDFHENADNALANLNADVRRVPPRRQSPTDGEHLEDPERFDGLG